MMMLEREIGRVHAEQLAADRRRQGDRHVRAGIAARLHRLADRIEPRWSGRATAYDA